MFGNNKDNNGSPSSSSSGGGGVNTIDSQTYIKGDLKAGGDIRIDGSLTGNLVCEAKLIIGPKGHIEGDVTCKNATIEGTFKGNLIVKESLTIQASAKVEGDVKAAKMAVLSGGQVSATCSVPYSAGEQKPTDTRNNNPLKEKKGATT